MESKLSHISRKALDTTENDIFLRWTLNIKWIYVVQANNLGHYLCLYLYFYLYCISRVKIIFVPRSGPNLARGGNLEQIWEVKVRNCRQAQNCRLGGGGRCGNDALLCTRCWSCLHWSFWCRLGWWSSSSRWGLPEAAFVSVEASLRKTSVKRRALASWNFTFSPIAIGDSLPFHSRFGFLFLRDGDQYSNGRHVVLKK